MTDPQIAAMRKKSQHELITEDDIMGRMVWTLRAIPAYDLMENIEIFDKLPKNQEISMDPENMSSEDRKMLKEVILPMMKAFLPACAINPPVSADAKDPAVLAGDAIHIREIPTGVIGAIFAKIVEITGLDKKAAEDRKNSPTPQ